MQGSFPLEICSVSFAAHDSALFSARWNRGLRTHRRKCANYENGLLPDFTLFEIFGIITQATTICQIPTHITSLYVDHLHYYSTDLISHAKF